MNLALNVIGFQLVWWTTVGGAARGLWWAGVPALALFALWQWHASPVRHSDLKLVLIAALTGFVTDSALAATDWLQYRAPSPWPWAAPVWIVVLWMAFALTLNHSMRFLRGHFGWAVLFGGICGPLAYVIAERIWGAVQLGPPLPAALAAIALGWALATPLLTTSAHRLARSEKVPA